MYKHFLLFLVIASLVVACKRGSNGEEPDDQPKVDPKDEKVVALLKKNKCFDCHTIDGQAMMGPTLKGLFGKKQTVMDKDKKKREIVVDEEYLKRAILDPQAEFPEGYFSPMPASKFSEEELKLIIDYIKSLK